MADKITMELYEYQDIKDKYPYWNQSPLMKELYMKGKKPMVLHADIVLDDSTATTLTETGAPTNEVLNFAAPVQLFLVSDNAGDTSKNINVIGQKADGSFGNFTLTSSGAASGYQQFTATSVAPAALTYTVKLSIDGVAINGGADIDVPLLTTDDTLAKVAAKINTAIRAIAATSVTAVDATSGLIRCTSDTLLVSSEVLIADGGAGNKIFTILTGVDTAVIGTDGTTAVDYGLWKTILWVGKIDTWAGNVILDVDGAGGTNYFTLALGVNATTGIFVIPDGYYGAGIDAASRATVVITTVNEMSMLLDHIFAATLNLYNPIVRFVGKDVAEGGKITFRSAYHTAAFETKSHVFIALWEC